MIKTILRFAGYTAGVAGIGVLVLLFNSALLLPADRQLAGASIIFMLVGIVLIFGSPAIVGYWFWRKGKAADRVLAAESAALAAQKNQQEILQRRFLERERLIDEVYRHRTAIRRNLNRAIRKNDYGVVTEDRRHEALVEFFASVDLDVSSIGLSEAIEIVSEQLTSFEETDSQAGFDPHNLPFDGHAFERWVANALSAFGWEADVTVASGDQGIDVIATRGGKKLGIQCKLYSTPIGNKAIQEAHAGKAYHGVDKVAVLSNADFTSSAKALAAATGVLLLSHYDIPNVYEKAFVA